MKRILLIASGSFAVISVSALAQIPPFPQPPSLEQQQYLQQQFQQLQQQQRQPQQYPQQKNSQQPRLQEQNSLSDVIAKKFVEHFQGMSCEQLKSIQAEPKPEMVQEFAKMLRSDPQIRTEFINKVAPPVANKMFDCGMIP